jgi:hypothetical protein
MIRHKCRNDACRNYNKILDSVIAVYDYSCRVEWELEWNEEFEEYEDIEEISHESYDSGLVEYLCPECGRTVEEISIGERQQYSTLSEEQIKEILEKISKS